MPKRLKSQVLLLKRLYSKKWRKIIKEAPDQLMLCLSDCSFNALAGAYILTKQQRRILRRHRDLLYKIKPKAKASRVRTLLLKHGTPKFFASLVEPSLAYIK